MFKRLIAALVCFTFIFSNLQYVHAQDFSINQLPVPGTMVGESAPFAPLALKGLIVNPQKPLEFQFIVDTGKGPQDTASIKEEANQLVKYFLAGLTIPEGDLWVNLSPYEKNRMVPEALGQTDLGRDLLAQDYILKQLTASLIYPEKDLGKGFWKRVYAKAQQQFGTTNIPVNTFNKVWILPDQAQVYENVNAAYVTKSTLKVMLDEDYTALQKHMPVHNSTDSIGSQIVREIVIPEITKEVNTGKNFAPLRQIYQALILAKWYKETIQNGLLDAVYTNKNKVAGVNLNDLTVKEQIYNRYLQAYKKGAFNYIKEDQTPDGQVVPRKYFSGGTFFGDYAMTHDGNLSDVHADGAMEMIQMVLDKAMKTDGNINNPKSTDEPYLRSLVETLRDSNLAERDRAASELGRINGPIAEGLLLTGLSKIDFSNTLELNAYFDALRYFPNPHVVEELIGYLESNKDHISASSLGRLAQALGRIGGKIEDRRAAEHLIPLLEYPDPAVHRLAAIALGELGDSSGLDPLDNLYKRFDTGWEPLVDEDTTLRRITTAKEEIIASQVNRLTSFKKKITPDELEKIGPIIDEVLNKIKSGKFKFKGEEIDVLNEPRENAHIIGQIDRNVVEACGLVHQTANAFLVSPQGKIMLSLRAHNKGTFPLHLTIPGGHVGAGKSYEEGMKEELKQEFGIDVSVKPVDGFDIYDNYEKSGEKDLNRERRKLFVGQLNDTQYAKYKAKQKKLEEESKLTSTVKEFKTWLEGVGKKEGFGEVWGDYEYDLQELRKASSAVDLDPKAYGRITRYIRITDKFKDGSYPIMAYLTPDLLDLMIGNDSLMEGVTKALSGKAIETITPEPVPNSKIKSYPHNVQLSLQEEAAIKWSELPEEGSTIGWSDQSFQESQSGDILRVRRKDNDIQVWIRGKDGYDSLTSPIPLSSGSFGETVHSVVGVSPDGSYFVTTNSDREACVWMRDVNGNWQNYVIKHFPPKQIKLYDSDGGYWTNVIPEIQFSPNGDYFKLAKDMAYIYSIGVDKAMLGQMPNHLSDAELALLKESDETNGFITKRLRDDERIKKQVIQIEIALGNANEAEHKAAQVIKDLNENKVGFKGEEVHILDGTGRNARVIGRIDRKIAEKYGYAHETANVVVLDPEGKIVLQLRNKDKGGYDDHLSVYGGHLQVGESHSNGALDEGKQETGLKEFASPMTFLGYEGYNEKGDNNHERRSWFIQRLTQEEWEKMKGYKTQDEQAVGASKLIDDRKTYKRKLAKLWDDGKGEVTGVFPVSVYDIEKAVQIENSDSKLVDKKNRYLPVTEIYKGVSITTDAFFTPDSLDRLVKNPELWDKINTIIQVEYHHDLAGHGTSSEYIAPEERALANKYHAIMNSTPDAAMGTKAENGGIDLNQINVKRNGKTVSVQFDQAQLNALTQGGFEGFTFKIESMTRISSPFQLLGIKSVNNLQLLAKA